MYVVCTCSCLLTILCVVCVIVFCCLFQTPPTPEEAGYVDHAYADEIGEQAVVVLRQGT